MVSLLWCLWLDPGAVFGHSSVTAILWKYSNRFPHSQPLPTGGSHSYLCTTPAPPPHKWTNTLGEDMEGLSVSRLMASWFRQMLYSLDRPSVLCRSPGPHPLNSRRTAPLSFDKPTSRLGQIIHKIDTKQPLMSWFSLHVLRGVWKMWSLMGKPSSAEQEERRDELGVLGEVSQLRVPPYGKVTPCGYL